MIYKEQRIKDAEAKAQRKEFVNGFTQGVVVGSIVGSFVCGLTIFLNV